MRSRSAALVLLLFFTTLGNGSEAPRTLRGLREKYQNKVVIVDGAEFERGMLEWNIATRDGSTYKEDVFAHLDRSYKGKRATVLALLLDSNSPRGQTGTNAMGELVNPDDANNPYVDVVVQFDDGMIAMKKGFPSTLEIDLASERDILAAEMDKQLPSLVGQNLFASGWSRLYRPDSTLSDLRGQREILNRLSSVDIPLLTPLTIVKVKYIVEEKAVVLKVRLPNGNEALAYTSHTFLENPPEGGHSILAKVSGTLLSKMPSEFTAKEIEAIKGQKLFRGMSETAVEYAIGSADKKNDWGNGGEQLVFFSGKLMVYLDSKGKVVDWQHLDE